VLILEKISKELGILLEAFNGKGRANQILPSLYEVILDVEREAALHEQHWE
jgi:hypothetical protein